MGVCSSPHVPCDAVGSSLIKPHGCAWLGETSAVWQLGGAQQCPPVSPEQKGLSCQTAPIWSQTERPHCSSARLHHPVFLLCCFGAEMGIFILVSLLEVKVPGVWNQRRRCHVSPLPHSFVSLPCRTFHLHDERPESFGAEAEPICEDHSACRSLNARDASCTDVHTDPPRCLQKLRFPPNTAAFCVGLLQRGGQHQTKGLRHTRAK